MRAIVGSRGFVGSNLVRQASFDRRYNSDDVHTIADERFDLVVSAAPSAAMFLANARPELDYERTKAFLSHLLEVRAERLVVISTIAVFDDLAAGCDETTAAYEATRAYGRHRRMIEEAVLDRFERAHVLRLPALFGEGLKKNFIFDLMNPVPTYLKRDVFESLARDAGPAAAAFAEAYALDPESGMMRYDRPGFAGTETEQRLLAALEPRGLTAPNFTNSDSTYQYYDLGCLWRDIERAIAHRIPVLNICSEPLRAGDIHAALLGRPFRNERPPLHREDVRSRHAAAWGSADGYLYSAAETMERLRAFFARSGG